MSNIIPYDMGQIVQNQIFLIVAYCKNTTYISEDLPESLIELRIHSAIVYDNCLYMYVSYICICIYIYIYIYIIYIYVYYI